MGDIISKFERNADERAYYSLGVMGVGALLVMLKTFMAKGPVHMS